MNKEKHALMGSKGSNTIPCLSVIVPYQSKLKVKKVLEDFLSMRTEIEEKELLKSFPPGMVSEVIRKFRKMIPTIDCPRNGKTIGIFVSPFAEKVYYFSPSHLEDVRLHSTSHRHE